MKTIYETRIHWISNLLPIVLITLGVISLVVVIPSIISLIKIYSQGNLDIFYPNLIQIISLFLLYLGLKGFYLFLLNSSIKIKLTSSHLTLSKGVFSKKITDISLNKYEGLVMEQNLLGRILNFGRLHITTGGLSQSYTIMNPLELRKKLNHIIFSHEN